MAHPIAFRPKAVDPRTELKKQLDAAPLENAEALLVAYDLLKTAHANGTLDLLDGLVGGRDKIVSKIAEYASLPESIAAIRNLLAAAKILMVLDPDTLDQLSTSIVIATKQHKEETKPPSLWGLARRVTNEDSRRGLSFMTMLLQTVGRSLRTTNETKRSDAQPGM